jgi:hypothetical protein
MRWSGRTVAQHLGRAAPVGSGYPRTRSTCSFCRLRTCPAACASGEAQRIHMGWRPHSATGRFQKYHIVDEWHTVDHAPVEVERARLGDTVFGVVLRPALLVPIAPQQASINARAAVLILPAGRWRRRGPLSERRDRKLRGKPICGQAWPHRRALGGGEQQRESAREHRGCNLRLAVGAWLRSVLVQAEPGGRAGTPRWADGQLAAGQLHMSMLSSVGYM